MNESLATDPGQPSGTGRQDPPVPTDDEVVNQTRPDVTIQLQMEFTKKLMAWAQDARSLHSEHAKQTAAHGHNMHNPLLREVVQLSRALRSQVMKTRPAIIDLVRYASGLIEGTRLKPITKLELRLRNAECEAALDAVDEAIRNLPT